MRAGEGSCREVDSAAQRQEDEWLLPLTPANLYKYRLLCKTLPNLKVSTPLSSFYPFFLLFFFLALIANIPYILFTYLLPKLDLYP